ncbi:MAG: tRNA-dihydrouridine synthase [bacterium]|nr:tRNA-dihydrouridine synthase [bacterium]
MLSNLPKPFFALAPMDDVTDTVFRQIVADCAPPDLFFTEFVNVDGLQSPGRPKLLKKLQFTDKEKPIVAQLWGINPENLYKTVKELKKMGFAGVDLNMGCPVKTVIKNGACAALINNRELAGEIIDATIEAAESVLPRGTHLDAAQGGGEDRKGDVQHSTLTANRSPQRSDAPEATVGVGGFADEQDRAVRVPRHFPVSVKTRVGFTTVDMSWLDFLLSQKLDLLSIHGRTAKQLSSVPADWELIGQIVKMRDSLSPDTLIIGNGDVQTRSQGLQLAKKYKLDGVMIGRGVFHDPFLFAQKSPWEDWDKEQKIELFCKHIKLFAQTWQHGEYKFESLKKFAKVYINGFDGASELRSKFMKAETPEEALRLLK